MDTLFPFGFPQATAVYLTLYVVTMVVHVAFMNYVVAGTTAIALSSVRAKTVDDVSLHVLKDWMPLMLSGAITAGIAPLLFVQILYKREFYTANLLLFNRWMAILPVLILGFYSLYLLKSEWLTRRSAWLKVLVAFVPLACVAFTGYSWTENHLLSVKGETFWAAFYATGSQHHTEPQMLPRLLVWLFGSLPTLALLLSWQLAYAGIDRARPLAGMALVGLSLTAAAGLWWLSVLPPPDLRRWPGTLGEPYAIGAVVGFGLQAALWVTIWLRGRAGAWWLSGVTLAWVVAVLSATAYREVMRIQALGWDHVEAMYPKHAEAFGKGGFTLFLGFFVANAALVAWVFHVVKTGHRAETPREG